MSNKFAAMSAEARAFLAAAEPLPPTPTNLEELKVLRDETLEGFRPAAESVKAQCVQAIDDIELGGVRTWYVTPKGSAETGADFTILYFYGGGFIQGSPFEDLPIIGRISHLTGAEVYAPWYRLAPENPFPAAHHDALSVYKEMINSVGSDKLVIMGESAGGNLALSTLLNAKAEGLPLPAATALLSPWSDLTTSPDSLVTNDGCDPSINNELIEFATGAYRGAADRGDVGVSPLYGDYDDSFPPTIVTSGTRDLLQSHSIRQAETMRQAGIDVTLRVWEGMWHVFEFYPELPEAEASLTEVAAFLREKIAARR